jgi:hypothetical protein
MFGASNGQVLGIGVIQITLYGDANRV